MEEFIKYVTILSEEWIFGEVVCLNWGASAELYKAWNLAVQGKHFEKIQ